MEILSKNYEKNISGLRQILDTDRNFDILEKHLLIGERAASLFFIDGLVKDDILEKVLEYFYTIKKEDMPDSLDHFDMQNLPYIETEVLHQMDDVLKNLLSGVPCLLISGIAD